jgi:hypothetical protein
MPLKHLRNDTLPKLKPVNISMKTCKMYCCVSVPCSHGIYSLILRLACLAITITEPFACVSVPLSVICLMILY